MGACVLEGFAGAGFLSAVPHDGYVADRVATTRSARSVYSQTPAASLSRVRSEKAPDIAKKVFQRTLQSNTFSCFQDFPFNLTIVELELSLFVKFSITEK